MTTPVRVRFAPSPTGFFHIGSARTALFNWLYARHTEGTFVLRVEDTDKERNTDEALQCLLDGMRWLGLDWDEGPEVGGEYGPYFQSQRSDIYEKYAEMLKTSGHAYEKEGALWFRVSGKPQMIRDAIRGNVERTEEKDFVIIRSNGSPGFHFVNVVDDITMKITHVIRGEDHLSNTSKHAELFEALNAPSPTYAHIPLILKSNGPGKMSKRDEGSLVEEYQKRHFLPEALRNYLCLLGWSPKDDREILPIEEIIALFDLPGINKNNARFDEQKLSHINGEYVRGLPLETFSWLAAPILAEFEVLGDKVDEDYLQSVMQLCQEKVRGLEDLPGLAVYFFKEDYPFEPNEKLLNKGDPKTRLTETLEALDALNDFSGASLEDTFKALTEKHGLGLGQYMKITRYAISGKAMGPSFYPMMAILGKDRVCERIKRFLETL